MDASIDFGVLLKAFRDFTAPFKRCLGSGLEGIPVRTLWLFQIQGPAVLAVERRLQSQFGYF